MSETQQTTAKGAGIGAAAGAVIGGVTGGGRGAAIGAGVGAGVGALGGYVWSQRMEEQKRSREQATKGTGVEVTQTADNQLKLEVPSDVSFDVGRAGASRHIAESASSWRRSPPLRSACRARRRGPKHSIHSRVCACRIRSGRSRSIRTSSPAACASASTIALALICRPRLLFADEPTSALDVTVQAEILALLDGRCRELGMALLLVTHDMGVVAALADRVAVMKAGRFVEVSATSDFLQGPRDPYSRILLDAVPTLARRA